MRLLALLGFLIISFPLRGENEAAIRAVLERVEQRYRGAKSYQLEAVITNEVSTRGRVVQSSELKATLAANAKGGYHVEVHGASDMALISDGQTTWTWDQHKKEYSEEQSAAVQTSDGEESSDEPGELSQLQSKLLGNYSELLARVTQAEVPKPEELKVNGQKVKCLVIRLGSVTKDNVPILRQFWIDADRATVLKSVTLMTREAQGLQVQIRETVTFKTVRFEDDLPADLFTFSPPAKARKVDPAVTASSSGALVGKEAPEVELKTLSGEQVSLSQFHGKPVLITFWATWCGPCRAELPLLAKLRQEYASKGLVVMGINDEGKSVASGYLKSKELAIPTLNDDREKAHRAYHIKSIPSAFLINADGVIVKYFRGGHPEETFREELGKLGL